MGKKLEETMTHEKWANMNPEEREAFLLAVRDEDVQIPLDMYVPKWVADTWNDKFANDRVGRLSIENLIAQFFVGITRLATNESEASFAMKVMGALTLLCGDVSIIDESSASNPFDDMPCIGGDKGGDTNGGAGPTFH